MNKLNKLIVLAFVMILTAGTASAQIKWGPKVGLALNTLKMDESIIDTDNHTGFTGGLMLEVQVPIVGLCFDVSAMYANRNLESDGEKFKREYLEFPINLKYKFGLFGSSNLVAPFLTTGPSFGFLVSKDKLPQIKSKNCDIAWNVGFGVELFSHLQVAANYGWGINKALEVVGEGTGSDVKIYDGKNRFWTITAAYLF